MYTQGHPREVQLRAKSQRVIRPATASNAIKDLGRRKNRLISRAEGLRRQLAAEQVLFF